MDRLWAPWRVKYVTKIIGKSRGACIFCKMAKEKRDSQNLIFLRSELAFAVLNLYPYNNGHSLVLPFRHVDDLSKLKKTERDDLFSLLLYTKALLQKVLKPKGFNIGMNLGRAAGAGFPGHLHIHIVPRWQGDINFMPAVGNTKVVSQSLEALYDHLVAAQKKDSVERRKL